MNSFKASISVLGSVVILVGVSSLALASQDAKDPGKATSTGTLVIENIL